MTKEDKEKIDYEIEAKRKARDREIRDWFIIITWISFLLLLLKMCTG